jgi:cell division control protein 6
LPLLRNCEVLSLDYVPFILPHREAELKQLERVFSILKKKAHLVAPKAFVTGDVGAGKTVLAKRFGMDFERELRDIGVEARSIYVNCRLEGTPINVLMAMIKQLRASQLPLRGFSVEEAVDVFVNCLAEIDARVIAVMDELDHVVKKHGSYLLYVLTRIQEKNPLAGQNLALVLIVRNIAILRTLDTSTLSTALCPIIRLQRYTTSELYDIISSRTGMAFYDNAVSPEAISLISDIAGAYGDARYAIELLNRAGTFAEFEHADSVEPEHIRQASSILPYSASSEDIAFLNGHQRLLLLAIARSLQSCDEAYLPIGEIERTYGMVCEELGVRSRGHTQLWNYLRELSDLGLVSKQVSYRGRKGKATVVGLAIPALALRAKLESLGTADQR